MKSLKEEEKKCDLCGNPLPPCTEEKRKCSTLHELMTKSVNTVWKVVIGLSIKFEKQRYLSTSFRQS